MRHTPAWIVAVAALSCGQTTRHPRARNADFDVAGSGGRSLGGAAAAPRTAGSGSTSSGATSSGGTAGDPNDTDTCDPPSAPTPRAAGDPGVPGTVYGPLMGGSVTIGDRVIQLSGTAATVAVPYGSHLFFTTSPGDELAVVYISIVIAEQAWPPGVYTRPFTGALEVTTLDDCSYRLDLATLGDKSSQFRLEVTESAQQGLDFYLRGRLDGELPSLNGRSPISLQMTIN